MEIFKQQSDLKCATPAVDRFKQIFLDQSIQWAWQTCF